jgi:hypothetical protein
VREAHRLGLRSPEVCPPSDRTGRQTLLRELEGEHEDRLNELDQRFYKYPDDLSELMYRYADAHAAEIEGAAEAGFGGGG